MAYASRLLKKTTAVMAAGMLSMASAWADEAASNSEALSKPFENADSQDAIEPLLDQQPVKRTTVDVQMIDPSEFKQSVRENAPRAVERMQVEDLAAESPFVLLPHRPNYIMPLSWQARPNNRAIEELVDYYSEGEQEYEGGFDHLEIVMQLSIKYIVAEDVLTKLDRLEIAYTNKSFWQAYNSDISRPFRETNHEPELIYSWLPKVNWLDRASISLNHQSNGQTSSLSRSWNRVEFSGAVAFSHGIWGLTTWWRIPEESSADPYDPSDNDNPDIEDYLGYGELHYIRNYGRHSIALMARNNLDFDDNRGAFQMDVTFPLTQRLKWFVHYFNGYGESLIDYNRYQERIGVGIKLSDWI